MNETNKIFILTDGCMWEQNKQNETFHPHAIEVIDDETGQMRYIRSGARIKFVAGDISETRDQETYNQTNQAMSSKPKDKQDRKRSKTVRKTKQRNKTKSV